MSLCEAADRRGGVANVAYMAVEVALFGEVEVVVC